MFWFRSKHIYVYIHIAVRFFTAQMVKNLTAMQETWV